MWRKIIGGTVAVIVVDQLTKFYISKNVTYPISLIGDFIQLRLVINPNAVFGLTSNIPLVPLTIFAVCVILLILYKSKSFVFALILGGAIGNLIDRVRIKAVIDWIDIGIGTIRWPTFNLADAAITIGIVWLVVREVMKGRSKNS